MKNGKAANSDLDAFVLTKFKQLRDQRVPVNGQMLMQIALAAPKNLKPNNFKASRGWLFSFQKRLKIVRRKCTHRLQQYIEGLIPEISRYLSILEEVKCNATEDFVFINFDEIPFFL